RHDLERDTVDAVDNRAFIREPHPLDDDDLVTVVESPAGTVLFAGRRHALGDDRDARREPGGLDHRGVAQVQVEGVPLRNAADERSRAVPTRKIAGVDESTIRLTNGRAADPELN